MNNNHEFNVKVDGLEFGVHAKILQNRKSNFDNASAVIDITCPDNLIRIDEDIFDKVLAPSIKLPVKGIRVRHVDLNDGLEEIGFRTFADTTIEEAIVPITVKYIGNAAFYECHSLEEVILNEGLEEIGQRAFYGTAITKVIVPITVKKIGNAAFDECFRLREVVLNEGLREIGEKAFLFTSIKRIIIPSTVEMIGKEAFKCCSKLEEVFISSLSRIASYSEEDLQDIFGDKAKIVIKPLFEFNEEEFKQNRQTVSEDMANELGIKLINLVSQEHLNDKDLKLAYELLIRGANPNIQDTLGNTGLMHMINKKLSDGINMYLASGCDINIANNMGDTALIEATRLNMVSVVVKLLDMGAYYQHQNMNDESALSIAKANNYQEIVNLIEACDKVLKPLPIKSTTSFNLDDIKARAKKLGVNRK